MTGAIFSCTCILDRTLGFRGPPPSTWVPGPHQLEPALPTRLRNATPLLFLAPFFAPFRVGLPINYLVCVKQPKFKNEQVDPHKMYLRMHYFQSFFSFNQYSTLSPLLTPPTANVGSEGTMFTLVNPLLYINDLNSTYFSKVDFLIPKAIYLKRSSVKAS